MRFVGQRNNYLFTPCWRDLVDLDEYLQLHEGGRLDFFATEAIQHNADSFDQQVLVDRTWLRSLPPPTKA